MKQQNILFVTENLDFETGSKAERLLKETNDAAYVDETRGITRVPEERWQLAQTYERNTWMRAAADATEDRNTFHSCNFDGFKSIRNRCFDHAIELGCGPFTNLRIIARQCQIRNCTLVDPLIESYLTHKHCTYSTKTLRVAETRVANLLKRSALTRAVKRVINATAPGVLFQRVAVAQLICKPVEHLIEPGRYDLVVMINVIEHCFDLELIFGAITKICAANAVFIFHDKLYSASNVKQCAKNHFDAGHPLRVDEAVILEFLEKNFYRIYERRVLIKDGYSGIDLSQEGIYFIGQRRTSGDRAITEL